MFPVDILKTMDPYVPSVTTVLAHFTPDFSKLPKDIRVMIFNNLKEKGGIDNLKAVAQTCRTFQGDIKDLNLTWEDLRLLHQVSKANFQASVDPNKIRISGWEGTGEFSRYAHINYVARILGGNQSSTLINKAYIASHVLPLFHWVPVTTRDLTDPAAILNENKTFRRVENPMFEKFFFNGDLDSRSLEECGFIPGDMYQYNYGVM